MFTQLCIAPTFLLILGWNPAAHGLEDGTAVRRVEPEHSALAPELEGLRERWAAAHGEFFVPGFAVVAVKDGEVLLLDAFGELDPATHATVTLDTAFYIASATKPFVAMTVLALVDDGKLDLDVPVKAFLPRFELPDAERAAAITLRDLLCHRAALDCPPIVLLDAYTGEITNDRYYYFLRTAATAGDAPAYSNIHFTLLGRVIESVAKKPWQEVLLERVLRPAGMLATTPYADEMYARADVARPQQTNGSQLVPAPHKTNATMHAAGGLGTTARDLARWLRLNLGRGAIDGRRIVSEELFAEMIGRQCDFPPSGRIRVQQGFGLGWGRGTYRGRPYAFHNGGYLGASAHTSFLPEHGIGVAVVTNCDLPASLFIDQIVSVDLYDRLLGESGQDLLPGLREEVARNLPGLAEHRRLPEPLGAHNGLSLAPERYAGIFVNEHWGTLTIGVAGESLTVRMGSLECHLAPAGPDAFSLLIGEEPRRGAFERDRDTIVRIRLDDGPIEFVRR